MPKREIPDSNILDLRQLAAQQSTPPPRRWRPRRERKEPTDSLPPIPRDWNLWRREVAKFVVAALIVVVPGAMIVAAGALIQASHTVQDQARDAGSSLQRGAEALTSWHTTQAVEEFSTAELTFRQAQHSLDKALGIGGTMLRHVPIAGRKIRSAEAALQAGEKLSSAAAEASKLLEGTSKPESIAITDDGVLRGSVGFLGPLLEHPKEFRPILLKLSEASQALTDIDSRDVPEQYASGIEIWQRLHPVFFGTDQRIVRVYDLLSELFASDKPREFLVLFENDDELRPVGGFPGTFLLVKFQAGSFAILDSPVTGPYDLTSQNPRNILPPQPILSVAPYWTFQDSAWFLDAPTSSKFVGDFYEQARGFRPDGVFYVTPHLIENLLDITGPIRPPGYGLAISSDNFLRATELQVEFGYDKSLNNPKEFLLDLMPILFERLGTLSAPHALQALITFFDQASQSNFIVTSSIPDIQKTLDDLHWNGEILSSDADYLAIVDTNLGGGKTDRVMKETITTLIAQQNNTLVHKIVIERKHQGDAKNVLTGKTNKTFIRVYTPKNSELKSIDGAFTPPNNFFFPAQTGALPDDSLRKTEGQVLLEEGDRLRISEESGKHVFGFWSVVDPGETQKITLTYTTPVYPHWSLVWQKQPGALPRLWDLHYRTNSAISSAFPQNTLQSQSKHEAHWKTTSETNQAFSVE